MKINSNILDNKTRLLHIEDNDSNSVSIMVLVNAGSRHEKNSTSGLAHFVEHNFFKGSKKYPSSKIIGMAIENLGGSSNAFTSYEYTGYYIKVPKEKFEEAIDIMADMLIHSVFPSVEVEKERGVIIEEIRMYEDIPMRKVSQSHMTNLFSPGHPLGWDIAGTIDTVSSFGRDNIIDYTDEFYNGSNIIVSIAGGTSKEKTFSVFEKYFSQLKSGNRSKFQKFTKKEIASPINIQKKELEQTHIVLGGYGIKRSDEDRYAVRVGQTILGRGFGSILFQTIREKLSLAYYIHADHSSFQEIGAWDISMGVDNKRVVEAVEAVVGELDSFVKGTF
ncbi:MAG TPA: pitrilysin family protein, partial [Candidatus Dojkabacteria bacterium]